MVKLIQSAILSQKYIKNLRAVSQTHSDSRQQKQNEVITSEKIRHDWVGPADPVSNLIRYKFHVPENESKLEKEFREKRIEVNKWNQKFWENHNLKFYRMKEEYVSNALKSKYPDETKKTDLLSPQEMSLFYKKFLDDNHQLHIRYNKEWYKKNIYLVWQAVQVFIYKLYKKFV